MNRKCLLILTKDNREFLTQQKYLPALTEFAGTFAAEVYLVALTHRRRIPTMAEFTAALCDPTYASRPDCRKLKRLYPPPRGRSRRTILGDAKKIRDFVRKEFLAGKPVSLKRLKGKFRKFGLTDACLCGHLSAVRKSLEREGHKFSKVGAGEYCLSAGACCPT